MRRRKLLAVAGSSIPAALAGCTQDDSGNRETGSMNDDGDGSGSGGDGGDGSDENTDEFGTLADSSPVFTGIDYNPDDADGELDVDFNARVYTKLQGEGGQFWEANDGEAYLLGQFRIENVGDSSVDFQPGTILVTADGDEAEWTVLVDGSRLRTTLEAGDIANEWQVFILPEDSTEVEVTVEPLAPVSTTVELDGELAFTFPES